MLVKRSKEKQIWIRKKMLIKKYQILKLSNTTQQSLNELPDCYKTNARKNSEKYFTSTQYQKGIR